MRYIVRLNPKAFNPVTGKVDSTRLWEVEQCATKDSEKCIWHRDRVRIGDRGINEFYTLAEKGQPPTELKFEGICITGQDSALVIITGKHHDVC